MRCRALPGGTSTGRPARDDNPQDRGPWRQVVVQKMLSTLTQKWRAVSSLVIQKVNGIASDSRQLSKKVVEPFFGRIATKAAN
jgi:hypothetical protein